MKNTEGVATSLKVLRDVAPSGDRPIETRNEDRLRRKDFARAVAEQLAGAGHDGLVIALTGAWGTGKTSLLNLIEDFLGEDSAAVILRFNPWFFSGAEQLVGHFFEELGLQLGEAPNSSLAAVGQRMKRYGKLLAPARLIPIAGPWVEAAGALSEAVGGALTEDPKPTSLRRQYAILREELAGAEQRVVVMVDDIDRLEDEEIREVMRLVRMVGDFPNVVYLLAFDSARVVRVLSRGGSTDGHKYLEKIVQLSYGVPEVGHGELAALLTSEVKQTLLAAGLSPADEHAFEVVGAVVAPLIATVRDIRRYVNVLPFTLALLGREVAAGDLLALEAFRLFLPVVYDLLPGISDLLTARELADEETQAAANELLDDVESAAGAHGAVINDLLRLVFPGAYQFRAGPPLEPETRRELSNSRRVADPQFLRIYLEKSLPGNIVPSAVVVTCARALGDPDALDELLSGLSEQSIVDLLARLPSEISSNPPSEVSPRSLSILVARATGATSRPGRSLRLHGVARFMRAVLEGLDSINDRCDLAKAVVAATATLEAQQVFIEAVAGGLRSEPLVSGECAASLKAGFRDRVLDAEKGTLVELPLGQIFGWILRFDETALAEIVKLLADDDLCIRYLGTLSPVGARRLPAPLADPLTARRRLEELRTLLDGRGDSIGRRAALTCDRFLELIDLPARAPR